MKMPGLLDDKELQAKYDQFRVNPIAMNPLQMAMYQAGEGIATGQGARLDQVLRGAAQGGVQGYNQALQNQQVYARAKAQMDAQRAQLERELEKERLEADFKRQQIEASKASTAKTRQDTAITGQTFLGEQEQKQAENAQYDSMVEQVYNARKEAGILSEDTSLEQFKLSTPEETILADVKQINPTMAFAKAAENDALYRQALSQENFVDALKYAPSNDISLVMQYKTKEDEEPKQILERLNKKLKGGWLKGPDGNFILQNGQKVADPAIVNSPEYYDAFSMYMDLYGKPQAMEGGGFMIKQPDYPAPIGFNLEAKKSALTDAIKIVGGFAMTKPMDKTALANLTGQITSLVAVQQTEDILNRIGPSIDQIDLLAPVTTQKGRELQSAFTELALRMKEKPYNLGVLQGIDNVVLQQVLGNPTTNENLQTIFAKLKVDPFQFLQMSAKILEDRKRGLFQTSIGTLVVSANVNRATAEKMVRDSFGQMYGTDTASGYQAGRLDIQAAPINVPSPFRGEKSLTDAFSTFEFE